MLLLPEGQWGKALEPPNNAMLFRTSEELRIENTATMIFRRVRKIAKSNN
jgi:hypothetical protein